MRKAILFILLALVGCIAAVFVWAATNPIIPPGPEFDARIAVTAYCKAVEINESMCQGQLEAALKSNPKAARIIVECYKGSALAFAGCIKQAGVNLP